MPLHLREVATTPDAAINRARSLARQIASQEFGAAQFGGLQTRGGEFGFGDLRPTHMRVPLAYAYATSFGRWTHPLLTGAALANWYNSRVHADAILLLYGIFNHTANPTIQEVFQRFGGEDIPLVHLNYLNGQWEPQSYFEMGYVVSPKQGIVGQLDATGATAALTEEIGYIGEVLGRRAYLIIQSAPNPA